MLTPPRTSVAAREVPMTDTRSQGPQIPEKSLIQRIGEGIWKIICVTWYIQLAIGAVIVLLWLFH